MWQLSRLILGSSLLVGLAACGDDGNNMLVPDSGRNDAGVADGALGDGGDLPEGSTADPASLVWEFTTVEQSENARIAGNHVEIARGPGGRLGLAYFRNTDRRRTCEEGTGSELFIWEVVYAEPDNDGQWTTEVVGESDTTGTQGLSIAFDAQGNPAVSFMGGVEDALIRCGASSLYLARRSGSTWNVSAVAETSASPTAFPEDATACAELQDYCNFGTVVGEWSSLLFHEGQPALAFRDIHAGFAQDDYLRSDLELIWQGNRLAIDAPYGGGAYASLAVRNGQPVVAHANLQEFQKVGLWVNWNDGSEWKRTRVVNNGNIGRRVRIGAVGDRMSLVHHDTQDNKLIYHESTDGESWTRTVIDQTGNTGRSPSLTFDGAGNPVVAYRHCGAFNPNNPNCDPQTDGLRYRVRLGGSWRVADVRNERTASDAEFVSVTLDGNNLPVIAYKTIYVDPGSSEQFTRVIVARGSVE